MSDVNTLVRRNVEYANHLSRVLGARDTETGWQTVDWICGCFDPDCVEGDCFDCCIIRIYLRPTVTTFEETPAGFGIINKYDVTTYAPVNHLDRIIYHGVTYEVETEPHIEYYLDTYMYRTFTMTRLS